MKALNVTHTPGKTVIHDEIPERTDISIEFPIADDVGTPIPAGAITELDLTLYVKSSLAIINGLSHVDIHGTSREVLVDGKMTLRLQRLDMVIVDETIPGIEQHVAHLDVKYNGGASGFTHEVHMAIRNQQLYPGP